MIYAPVTATREQAARSGPGNGPDRAERVVSTAAETAAMIDAFRLLPSGPAAARCEDPEDPEYAWSWARLS